MQNSLKITKQRLYYSGVLIITNIIFLFLYDIYFDAWIVERKNLRGTAKYMGWGLQLSFVIFFSIFWRLLIKYDNLEIERGDVPSGLIFKRVKKKYYMLGAIAVFLMVFIFPFDTFFDLWDKSLNDVPFVFTQFYLLYILLAFFIGNIFWRSALRYSDYSDKNKSTVSK